MDRTDALRLDDQLCFALYAATNAITRRYRPLLGELGLTYPQYLVMLVLWQDGPSSVGGLAGRLELEPHAVSPLLRRLERAGLLERRRATDRRRSIVSLTARGRALERDAARAQAAVACATGLEPDDLDRLRDRLRELAGTLASERAEAPARADAADRPVGPRSTPRPSGPESDAHEGDAS